MCDTAVPNSTLSPRRQSQTRANSISGFDDEIIKNVYWEYWLLAERQKEVERERETKGGREHGLIHRTHQRAEQSAVSCGWRRGNVREHSIKAISQIALNIRPAREDSLRSACGFPVRNGGVK